MGPLKQLGSALLDAVYPPRCGLCGSLGPAGVCDECSKGMARCGEAEVPSPCDGAFGVYVYEGRASQAVRRLKFDRATGLANWMSGEMASAAQQIGLMGCDTVVPVPISRARRFERGFNQAELLCGGFGGRWPVETVLERTRHTKPQVGLAKAERLSNLEGAIRAVRRCDGGRFLLIDDVATTGGTAMSCARALKAKGAARVCLLVFAVEPLRFSG